MRHTLPPAKVVSSWYVPAGVSVIDMLYVPSAAVVAVFPLTFDHVPLVYCCSCIVIPATPAPVSFRVSFPVTENATPVVPVAGQLIVSVEATGASPIIMEVEVLVDGFKVVVLSPPTIVDSIESTNAR